MLACNEVTASFTVIGDLCDLKEGTTHSTAPESRALRHPDLQVLRNSVLARR